ncbi:hypothetical protein AM493_10230 [Flavobacterium akiainvivens]|uniref:O-antigen ligase-related domain-containing protein n=2 Tax=Flavobacterium akiainvivens TaxID=1202724 RepID=A0A0M8M9I8_9FLAO|nr:hypothetical protein AM493_10230 [Flavobacterium akiainvivens]
MAIFSLLVNYDAIPNGSVLRVLPIILFLLVGFRDVVKWDSRMFKPIILPLMLAFLVSFGILTSGWEKSTELYKVFKVLTFLSFIFAFTIQIYRNINKGALYAFVNTVYKPIILFIVLNIVMYLIGFKGPYDEESIGKTLMLSYFGISVDRVRFPLVAGINAYGSLIGILLVISFVGWGIIKIYKKTFLYGIIACIFTLLLTDSRGPIFYALIIFCLIKFFYAKSKSPRFLWIIPLLGFIGPFIVIWVLNFLATTSYGASVSRSSEDLLTGNGRLLIWLPAVSEFLTFKSQHIFGYGEYGHYVSGRSLEWEYIFGSKENSQYVHPHNTILSLTYDNGYVGVVLFTIIQYYIIRIIKKIWNSSRNMAYIFLSNILFFNLVGITETMFGFYYQNVIYLFFAVNIFAFIIGYYTKKIEREEVALTN